MANILFTRKKLEKANHIRTLIKSYSSYERKCGSPVS